MEAIVQAGVGRSFNRIGVASASSVVPGMTVGDVVWALVRDGLGSESESKATAGPSASLGMTVGIVMWALVREWVEIGK
jgi:hypothetical protein